MTVRLWIETLTYTALLESVQYDIQCIISRVDESYCGEYDTDIHFVSNLLEDTGDLPSNLPSYIHIDWEQTAWNIMLDYSTANNHYFRNI